MICFNGIILIALLKIDCWRWNAGQKHVISEEVAEIIQVRDDGGLHLGYMRTSSEKW